MPDAHRAQAHIEIAESNPDEAEPREAHVPLIEASHAVVSLFSRGRLRDRIADAAYQMAQRVATEHVAGKQNYIEQQHQRSHVDVESVFPAKEPVPGIFP